MKIYVGFSTTRSIISRLILIFRRFANRKAEFSHTFPCFKVDNSYLCIDAEYPRIEINTLASKRVENTELEIWSFPYYDIRVKQVFDTLSKLDGERYGLIQLIGMLPITLMEKFKVRMKNMFSKRWICSEISHQAVINTGSGEICGKLRMIDKDSIAPDHIRKLMSETEGCKMVAVKRFGGNEIIWLP